LFSITCSKLFFLFQLCVEHVLQKAIRDFKEKVVNSSTSKPESQQLLDDITEFKSRMTNQQSSTGFASPTHKSPCAFYSEMIEYFGDALSIKLPEIQELKTHVFLPQERDLVTVITDPTAAKSGEELLDELVNEVKREEMLKKKQVNISNHMLIIIMFYNSFQKDLPLILVRTRSSNILSLIFFNTSKLFLTQTYMCMYPFARSCIVELGIKSFKKHL